MGARPRGKGFYRCCSRFCFLNRCRVGLAPPSFDEKQIFGACAVLPPPPWGGLGWGQQTIAQRTHLKRRKPLQVATTLFDAQSRWGKPHPTTTPRNVGEKYGTTMYKQHRSPPPRPSPAADAARPAGERQFGGKMGEQLSNHSPFYSLPRSEAQRGRVGEGVAL